MSNTPDDALVPVPVPMPIGDKEFMWEVMRQLGEIAETTKTTSENAVKAFDNSVKARTRIRVIFAALALVIAATGVSLWSANRSRTASDSAQETARDSEELAIQVNALLEQQNIDREVFRLSSCQTRNSAQEAGRQSSVEVAIAAAVGGLDQFAQGMSEVVPEYVVEIEKIRAGAVAAAEQAARNSTPAIAEVDTDCNFDRFFTDADYENIVPEVILNGEAVPVPPNRIIEPPATAPTTTQPS